jgi:hypothetical protein
VAYFPCSEEGAKRGGKNEEEKGKKKVNLRILLLIQSELYACHWLT